MLLLQLFRECSLHFHLRVQRHGHHSPFNPPALHRGGSRILLLGVWIWEWQRHKSLGWSGGVHAPLERCLNFGKLETAIPGILGYVLDNASVNRKKWGLTEPIETAPPTPPPPSAQVLYKCSQFPLCHPSLQPPRSSCLLWWTTLDYTMMWHLSKVTMNSRWYFTITFTTSHTVILPESPCTHHPCVKPLDLLE